MRKNHVATPQVKRPIVLLAALLMAVLSACSPTSTPSGPSEPTPRSTPLASALTPAASPMPLAAPPPSLAPIQPDNAAQLDVIARLGKGAVKDYAWSPNGEVLAVATPLGVYFYEAAALSEQRFIPTATPAQAVAFSPDGATLAGAVADNSLHLWEVAGGSQTQVLTGHTQPASRLAFSPDGRWLASGVVDGTLRLWDIGSGRERYSLSVHPQSRFLFSPDGRWLAVGGGKLNRQVQVWNLATGELAYQLEIAPDLVGMAFSPNSQTLAVLPSGERITPVLFWDFATGQTRRLQHAEGIRSLALSPDGSILATGDFGRAIRLWDVASGQIIRTLGEHPDYFFTMAFSPSGQLLASADETRLKVWDVGSGTARYDTAVHAASQLVFSPDGGYLAFRQGGTLSLLDLAGGRVRSLPGHSGIIASLAFSPDTPQGTGGQTLAAGDWQGLTHLWHLPTGQPLHILAGHVGPVGNLSFHPNGQTLATGGINEDKTVRLWDLNDGQPLGQFEGDPGYPMQDLTFSPDGRTLAGGGMKGVILRDVETGEMHRLEGHAEVVLSVAFSPDGKRLASGSLDGTVVMWDLASGQALYTLPEKHGMGAARLIFSPDGKLLISGDQQGNIWGWDVETGELLGSTQGRGHSMALSPDGRLLAFKQTLDDIVLWDVYGGREAHRWLASQPIAFSPGGQLLATGSPDGIITLWGVTPITPTPTPDLDASAASGEVTSFTSTSPDGAWFARGAAAPATDTDERHVWLDVSKTDGSVEWRVVDERSGQALGQTTPKPFGWSGDGRYLYFTNYGVPDGCPGFVNGSDLHRVDLTDGNVTELVPGVGFWLALSPDESKLAYVAYGGRGLVVRDLATGEEREIGLDSDAESAQLGHILWSPDGTQLALTAGFKLCGPPEERAHSILHVDLSNGEHSTLVERDSRLFVTQAWQSLGRVLLTDQDHRRWELDVETGDVSQLQ